MTQSASQIARAYYRRQAALTRQVATTVQTLWWSMTSSDLSSSWEAAGPAVLRAVTDGQLAAAAPADAYVRAVEAADDTTPAPAGRVRPAAFAGRAADGRSLETLLQLPVITTKQAIAAGASQRDAMLSGLNQLLKMAATEVADAGRSAAGVSIAADTSVQGYVRVLSSPSCGRCVVLAGATYRWNAGFDRHPHCDCVHLPTTLHRRPGRRFNPRAYFDSLTEAEQAKAFTVAGARAIREGTDIGQVVNARRGISTIGSRVENSVTHRGRIDPRSRLGGLTVTTDGMTKRGFAARRLRQFEAATGNAAQGRLTPEAIYRIASDRTEAIRLLHRYGYLI